MHCRVLQLYLFLFVFVCLPFEGNESSDAPMNIVWLCDIKCGCMTRLTIKCTLYLQGAVSRQSGSQPHVLYTSTVLRNCCCDWMHMLCLCSFWWKGSQAGEEPMAPHFELLGNPASIPLGNPCPIPTFAMHPDLNLSNLASMSNTLVNNFLPELISSATKCTVQRKPCNSVQLSAPMQIHSRVKSTLPCRWYNADMRG